MSVEDERKRCADLVRNALTEARNTPVRNVMTATASYTTMDSILLRLLYQVESPTTQDRKK